MKKTANFLGYLFMNVLLGASHFTDYETAKYSPLPLNFSDFQSQTKRVTKSFLQQIKSNPINPNNQVIFEQVMQYAAEQSLSEQPMSEILQAIADYFVGTPYRANLLDQSNQETLVVSLDGFDCVLFVETVLAIARGVALQDYSYQTFTSHLLDQRYRNANLNGYCSRLHYFSEWIFENQSRGTVINISQEIGGTQLNKTFNFMSTNWQSYPRLVSSEADYQCIVEMEAKLNPVKIHYLPQNQIQNVYQELRAGDIVAVTTDIAGLDVTHTGLVYRHENGRLGFIHASPIGSVTIAEDLATYISHVESAIGIMVARPVDPRQQ